MTDFSKIVETYFYRILDLKPFWGSDLGLEEYDSLMPHGGRSHIEAVLSLYESFNQEIKAWQESSLSFTEKIDRDTLIYSLELDIFKLKELQVWKSFPFAPAEIGSALYTLISRDATPFEKRIQSIIARMSKIPEYLQQSRELLEQPVWVWVEIGIESCHRMRGYLEFIENMTRELISDKSVVENLFEKSTHVREAFAEFESWLYTEVLPRCSHNYAISEEKYDRLLEKRMLSLTREEILGIGEEYVRTIRGDIDVLVRKIDSTASLDEILKKIQENHPPDFEGVIKECTKMMNQAREFVGTSGFATLPEGDVLDIQATPIFMRHFIPFAAYSSPGKFDKVQKGIYMITPVEGGSESLSRFCFDDLINTSVHEGYPGHHLQLVCANLNPSLARIFSHATEFCEGWAHYCEDAMADAGFMNTLPSALIRQKDMLWRAWRIIIDIKLCTGRISFEEAIRLLVEEVGMDEVPALAEIKRYTYTPGYQLSYLIGKHLLKAMKENIRNEYPGQFSQKELHDILLYSGNLPIFLMEKVVREKMNEREKGARV